MHGSILTCYHPPRQPLGQVQPFGPGDEELFEAVLSWGMVIYVIMSLNQTKMKITPRIKLNYSIYTQNITEQVNEWQAALYLNFLDFEKAFDSSHGESM